MDITGTLDMWKKLCSLEQQQTWKFLAYISIYAKNFYIGISKSFD